jgi:hypothetical protein
MIPMADNMNHVDFGASNYEVINTVRHIAADKHDTKLDNNTYFTTEKFLNNYEMVFTKDELKSYEKDIKGHFNRDAYNRNLTKRTVDYWLTNIKKPEIQIWDLNLGEGECFQDNDSEDSDENEEEQERIKSLGVTKPWSIDKHIENEGNPGRDDEDEKEDEENVPETNKN